MKEKGVDLSLSAVVEAGLETVIVEIEELEKLMIELALSADHLSEPVTVIDCGVEQ
jgi:hypothetical protein